MFKRSEHPDKQEREDMSHQIVIEHSTPYGGETIHAMSKVGLLDYRVDRNVDQHLDALSEQCVNSPGHKTGVIITLYGPPDTDIKELTIIRPRLCYNSLEDVAAAVKAAMGIPAEFVIKHVCTDWRLMKPRISESEYRDHLFGEV